MATFMMGSMSTGPPLHRILERHRTGDLERHFGGVDLVIRSIVKSDLDVNNIEACKNARLH